MWLEWVKLGSSWGPNGAVLSGPDGIRSKLSPFGVSWGASRVEIESVWNQLVFRMRSRQSLFGVSWVSIGVAIESIRGQLRSN